MNRYTSSLFLLGVPGFDNLRGLVGHPTPFVAFRYVGKLAPKTGSGGPISVDNARRRILVVLTALTLQNEGCQERKQYKRRDTYLGAFWLLLPILLKHLVTNFRTGVEIGLAHYR